MRALLVLAPSLLLAAAARGQESTFDIVIYGGTSSGVAAAVQAARMNKSVVLIEPSDRVGGLTTGGLGQTDIGNKSAIGGVAREFYEEPGELCLIGLGGGTLARGFSRYEWRVDAVEIDPVVIDFAYEYFLLDHGDAQVFEMDGRRYLQGRDKKYDLIVFDAFGGGNIPFQLVTAEAFGLAASRLHSDGLLVLNIEAVGWHDIVVRSVAATLGAHFSQVIALPIAEPPDRIGNVILMASNRELELQEELPIPESRFSSTYDKVHTWDNRFEPDTRGVPILTDDKSPVDLWAERINFASRRELHHYFRDADLYW